MIWEREKLRWPSDYFVGCVLLWAAEQSNRHNLKGMNGARAFFTSKSDERRDHQNG